MIKSFIFFLIMGSMACGLSLGKKETLGTGEVKISWADTLKGDFSFTSKWDYPEGIYRNQFGQLSCDGICPPEMDRMIDAEGKIYKDSLTAFYELVDTTHLFHSIQSEAWTYEWAGANFITAERKSADTVICYTHNNVSTHSTLMLTIVKNLCRPVIDVSSITSGGNRSYECKVGQIEIDKTLWQQGVLKANFDFVFNHTENPDKPMYWKGQIYTRINSQ